MILTQPLDREVKDRHLLRVMATDGKFQASVPVDVHVLDINDNSPQCEQVRAPPCHVTSLSHQVPPAGLGDDLCHPEDIPGPGGDGGEPDPDVDAGPVWVFFPADSSKSASISGFIWVMDGGGAANGALTVVVLLLLLQLVYQEALMENSPSSRFVLKVSAADPDVGANGQVSYSLHGPNADQFHLNYRTGMDGGQRSRRRKHPHPSLFTSVSVSFLFLCRHSFRSGQNRVLTN